MDAVVATVSAESGPPDAAAPDAAGSSFEPAVLVFFGLILAAVCWQNWVLARRAEERSLVPDWLRSWFS